jgi:cell wall-associated NlpC family hydrolase
MASHRAPKVSARVTTTAATVVGVTAGTVALLPGTSQASPTPSLDQVKAQVQQYNTQAEQATNQYDAAKEQYAKLQQKVDGLQSQITQEQATLNSLQTSMGLQAAAAYRAGGISQTLQLALNASPDKYLSQAGIESQQAEQEAMLMRSVAQDKAQLALDKKSAADALAQQQQVLNQAASAKTTIQGTLQKEKNLLSTLTAQQQVQVTSTGGTTNYSPSKLPSASGRAGAAVAYAEAKIGDPYVWGATGPSAFDCSGLTSAAWAAAGVQIPRTSEEQFAGLSQFYSASQLQPGDLVFFEGDPPGHVAIYVGNDMVIHAPNSSTVVQYASLDPSSPHYIYMSVVGYARVN